MSPEADATLPLVGLRVVSIEQAIAVPLASRHLADLGAEVIKVERPEGDFARHYDSLANGLSVHFAWTNRGKKSVVLDLKTKAGYAALLRLAATADVFMHNMGPGVMGRLGLDYEVVSAVAEKIVYCELSGYGADGPMGRRKAYDLLIQSETGAAMVSGTPDQPAKVGISVVDISGAMYVLSAVLAALTERERTGKGRHLRLTLFDGIAEWMSVPFLQARYGEFSRSGRFHNSIFPYGPFDCSDGEIVLAVQNDREWMRLCAAFPGFSALAEDDRFATSEGRHLHRFELYQRLSAALLSRTVAQVEVLLDAADVPFARTHTVEDAAAHAELVERGRWQSFDSEVGAVDLLRSPFHVGEQWRTPPGAVPGLGQHTAEVLASVDARPANALDSLSERSLNTGRNAHAS